MASWRDQRAVERALDVLGELGDPDGALGARTTYRVGGPAAVVVHIGSDADLSAVAEAKASSGLPILVVGKGSNLLVSDRGFEGQLQAGVWYLVIEGIPDFPEGLNYRVTVTIAL